MTDSNLTELETVIILDEGLKTYPYKDTLGNWTIAVGYLIGKELQDLRILRETAIFMMREKIGEATKIATKIFGAGLLLSILPARRAVILSLIYNMGEMRFRTFKHMIEAIHALDWNRAAEELRDSKWAKQVDPKEISGQGRDDRLISMLETGEYSKEYGIKT